MKTKKQEPVQVRLRDEAARQVTEWAELTGLSANHIAEEAVALVFNGMSQEEYLGKFRCWLERAAESWKQAKLEAAKARLAKEAVAKARAAMHGQG